MLVVLIAMQLPPEPAPETAPPAPTPAIPPPAETQPAPPPPPVPPPAYTPPPPYVPPRDQPKPPSPEREVRWFVRMELGLGPRGFAENNALLEEAGYGGVKFWATLDGAYMFHRHVGAGLWLGMNRRSSQPGGASARLNEASYFIGAELPILLWGRRAYAFHATPRVAFLAGELELDDGENTEMQETAIFGGALSFQSFTYHLGSSIAFLHAPAGAPGELGRGHDYGGLYFTIGGTLDG